MWFECLTTGVVLVLFVYIFTYLFVSFLVQNPNFAHTEVKCKINSGPAVKGRKFQCCVFSHIINYFCLCSYHSFLIQVYGDCILKWTVQCMHSQGVFCVEVSQVILCKHKALTSGTMRG